jgi:8-oxo-dGTP diphosphatase
LIDTIHHSYTPEVVIELFFFRVSRWSGEIRNLIFNDTRWVKREDLPSLDFLEADRGLVAELSTGKLL